jgi:5-(carboxyamino)imidazole ribonucleotide mutase
MKIMVVMGSKSDMPVAEKVEAILKEFEVPYDIEVASAHRNPPKVEALAKRDDVDVFIAIAGLSAALPGVIASHTTKPVIGVPVSGKVNMDSILSIVQMPPGIPVAAVGLDNGKNAAMLAVEILAMKYPELSAKIGAYREKMR